MNKYVRSFLIFLGVIVGLFLVLCVYGFYKALLAQDQQYTQIDMDFILRQKIEKFQDIYQHVTLLDRQTQTDTLTTKVSAESDTVYLDSKYGDTDYEIFVTIHTFRPEGVVVCNGIPLTDSSFTIKCIAAGNDSSIVQWMTIRK